MKKIVILFLFFLNVGCHSQSQFDTFISNFNASEFETIYQSFSAKMKEARTKQYYFNFFSRVKKENGIIQSYQLINFEKNSKNSIRSNYNTINENGNLTIWFTINSQNEIIGLYILKDNKFI